MKIGILIDRMNVGGVEKVALEEVSALRDAGQDAVLVILRRKGLVDDAFPDLRKGVPIVYLDDRLPAFLKTTFTIPPFYFFSWFHLTYPFLIPWVVKRGEFDYIVSHGTYTTFTAVAIKKVRKIHYSAFIWDPIGYILERVYAARLPKLILAGALALSRWFDSIIVKNSDVVLAGGPAHDDYINKLVPGTKTKVIPPSVHLSVIKAIKKQNVVVMVTAWKRGKNPEYVFELIKQLPNLKVKIVGLWLEGDYQQEFHSDIISHGYTDNIELVGGVSEAQLARHYEEALVFLQTNDDRGFGMPALEAAAHGTPIIIPKGQGVCELLEDQVDGFYTAEHDTQSVVRHLRRLLDDTQLAIRMGRHAREVVERKYSWGQHAETLLDIIGDYAD